MTRPMVKTLRYLVVDVPTGRVLDDSADLDEALDECLAREADAYQVGEMEPDLGVVDLARIELVTVEFGTGRRVRHWYDGFHNTWRPILAVAA